MHCYYGKLSCKKVKQKSMISIPEETLKQVLGEYFFRIFGSGINRK